jgi:hypothetical protein
MIRISNALPPALPHTARSRLRQVVIRPMVTARDNLIGARLDQTLARVRDDPGLLWLRALSESRLSSGPPARDQDTRNRRRWPMISDHGSLISRMMQVCGRYR